MSERLHLCNLVASSSIHNRATIGQVYEVYTAIHESSLNFTSFSLLSPGQHQDVELTCFFFFFLRWKWSFPSLVYLAPVSLWRTLSWSTPCCVLCSYGIRI
ncbi:hypothetical protein BX666DRAFT_1917149 [Dichotomocladium elegans]|nr:hypothetical protein BX666DRAFT_1917149 [Dichotomocladium elegans]